MILIDGHNLIPKIRGLSLSDENDEEKLIQILQDYCRIKRKTVEVYFDGAPMDHAGTRNFGNVKAHFIRKGTTADDMIIPAHSGIWGKRQVMSKWSVQISESNVRSMPYPQKSFPQMNLSKKSKKRF